MQVRLARIEDADDLADLRHALWPESPREEHRTEVGEMLAGRMPGLLPRALFVAADGDGLIGFVEVALRSYADGCDPRRPCGFLEGWYVDPLHHRRGVGRALVERAEAWARQQGCTEMASDTWLDNEGSQRAHAALGYEVVDRCVNFRKQIAETAAVRPRIERAEPAEAETLTMLAHAAKRHWGYSEELIALWRAELTFLPEYIARNAVYVARNGERAVGVYALVRSGDELELDHLWVDPGVLGRGVGRALVEHATATARDRGASRIRIVSDPNAESFYAKLGATRTGTIPSTPAGRRLPVLYLDL